MMIEKELLVTGSPRSGTHFYAELLQVQGLAVKHEAMGEYGCVSSLFCVDDRRFDYMATGNYGPIFSEYRFKRILHLVRHPLKVITSLAYQMPDVFWSWQEYFTGIVVRDDSGTWKAPTIEQAAAFWLTWTGIVDRLTEEVVPLEACIGRRPPVAAGDRARRPLGLAGKIATVEELGAEAGGVVLKANRYGYEI